LAAYNKFQSWVENMTEGANLGTDVFKLVLTNSAPIATNTVLANITQVGGGNGYTTGGNTITTTSSAQAGGVMKLVLADLVITATGGSIGPFRYVVVVDSTLSGSPLVMWADYGSSITLLATETLTIDFDQTNGFFTVT
jgi:hypothetical protein